MSKSNRSSLLDLTHARKPLAPPAQSRVPPERAEEILLETSPEIPQEIPQEQIPSQFERRNTSAQETLPSTLPEEVQLTSPETFPEISLATKLKPKQLSRRVAWSLKMEPELLGELRSVAEYNRLVASDLVHEALEMHLKHFPHPPDAWKRRR